MKLELKIEGILRTDVQPFVNNLKNVDGVKAEIKEFLVETKDLSVLVLVELSKQLSVNILADLIFNYLRSSIARDKKPIVINIIGDNNQVKIVQGESKEEIIMKFNVLKK